MASANPSITEIIATTIRKRSDKVYDNVLKHNAILTKTKLKGNNRPVDGGYEILEAFSYQENSNASWYSGYDTLAVGAQENISGAVFQLKQLAVTVPISGLEALQNAGEERKLNLAAERLKVAENTLKNMMAAGLYSDGTGYGGKQIVGLGAAVVANPTTGTYGGIDRATWSFWQNKYTGSLGAQTATTIQGNMNTLYNSQVRGNDAPDLILGANAIFGTFEASLQPLQRFTTSSMAELGFQSYKFKGADVVLDGGIGGYCPANVMYFLNTDFLFLRHHSQRNFVTLDPERRVSINQDASVEVIAWAGAFTCSGAQFQGYFQGS